MTCSCHPEPREVPKGPYAVTTCAGYPRPFRVLIDYPLGVEAHDFRERLDADSLCGTVNRVWQSGYRAALRDLGVEKK